ncbi:PREDICTED: muscle M-line assembly protein unc-89-like [Habropoda laboriosa]|uniref:muscle M-line assembly protein unc-89-like n=1 Tax=Habropoda laboriosa TaxID=597456 RepID=UPI00083E4A65|nr:PREDICTED: muscle M-line assembly protein unc-89-like [Habropoda laboriosa]
MGSGLKEFIVAMNLALHGFLLQVLLSIFNLQHGSLLCSAGEPGYLDFDNLPETNFSCQGKVIGGYYADVEAGCQMFHVCTIGQKDLVSDEIMDIKFLCLNGTVFDQETRVCERVDEVDCSKSERFYNLNLELYGNNAVTLRAVSKLTISPVPTPEPSRSVQTKTSSQSSQQPRISGNFLSTPSTDETTVRSFYPTPRSSSKSPQSSQSTSEQVTQHIHVLPPVQIPQLKPHQITINLPPPDLQRIVQNPSSLLPSQSRVIVTAKASVSDESGRPLNTTQLVTLPLPTIPASYDDYKEGDESFDPFYRDVPKIRNNRGARRSSSEARTGLRPKRSVGQTKSSMVSFVYGGDTKKKQDGQIKGGKKDRNRDKVNVEEGNKEFKSIKESLMKFRDILFGGEFTEDTIRSVFEGSRLQLTDPDGKVRGLRKDSLEDLETKASKNFKTREYDDETEEEALKKESDAEEQSEGLEIPLQLDTKASDAEEYIDIDDGKEAVSDSKDDAEEFGEIERGEGEEEEEEEEARDPERDIDVVILDPNEYLRMKSAGQESLSKTTEATIVSHPEDKQDLNVSKNQDDTIEESKQPKKTESDQEKLVEEERKEKPKEQNPRRKSSRIRSSRGKISSRKKETKNKEPVKPLEEKVPEQKVETTTEPVVISEVEQIDKHIFDEPESQTSKEVDTRAVGNHSGYVKSHQTGKDQDSGKENRKGEANEYEILKKQAETLEKDEEKIDKLLEDNEETTIPTLDEEQIEEEERIEVPEEPEVTEKVEHPETSKENSSIEHENVEDESTTVFSNDDSQEDSHEVVKSSRKEKSMKFEDSSREVSSHRQDKSRKIDDEEEEERESQEYSTIKSEEFNSQELYDSTESFYENTDELDTEDDYGSAEDATVSSEHSASEEVPSSREESTEEHNENESTLSDQEVSTEGVLKFTDELPKDKKEDVSENKKPSESVENIAHDYVDDNYEPDNYKEQESSDSNNLSDEKTNKEMLSDGKMENIGVETTTEPEKSPDEETESPYDFSTDQMDLLQTTTSTTTTSTTTARPTPLKLFKPIAARKNYNYIPPTTTPNPVVIKPRLSLLNPKPAKPPKSYNELAPKPVIRKFTLLARKQTTTMATTRYREEDSTETTEMTTTESPLTTTETSRSEENVLEGKLEKDQILVKGKDDQDSSPSEQKSPTNVKKEEDEGFTPYPITRLTTLASTIEKTLKEVESTSVEPEKQVTPKNFTLLDIEIVSTTALSTFNETDNVEEPSSTTMKPATEEETSIAPTTKRIEDVTEYPSTSLAFETTIVAETTSKEAEEIVSTTMRSLRRKSATLRRQDGFNCLEKEMYRFYGDNRDCRLFHYCSPGFTSRQVLDFRFVCEEGTAFDEESQSCSHDGRSGGCLKRQW